MSNKKTVIKVAIVEGMISLTSETRNGDVTGGHARARPGRRIRWECADESVDKFNLSFESFDEEEGAVGHTDDWPFTVHDAEPANAKVKPFKGTVVGATAFEGRVHGEAGVFKYSIKAFSGNDDVTLDPIIIVER